MARRALPFTDKSVKAAPYLGAGLATEYRIEGNPGLVLVVRKPSLTDVSSRGWRFHFSTQRKGRQIKRRVRLGDYPRVSLAEARRKSADLMERVKEDGDIVALEHADQQAADRAALTFANLLDEYLSERKDLARIDEVERELRKDAIPALGAKHPALITAGDIDEVGRAIMARGTEVMASRLVMHLKALYNFVILDRPSIAEHFGITANPAAMLGRRRRGGGGSYAKPKARERVLDDTEIVEWWRALDDSEKRIGTKRALQLVLVTAQRPGEVRRARKQDLHLTAAEPYWMIPAEHAKNGRQHYVPLSRMAVRLFSEAKKHCGDASSEFVFPSPDTPEEPIANVVLPSAQRDLFVNTLKAVTPATVHDLRRSAATGMRRLRIDRDTVGMVLNHTAKGVTAEHYDWYDGAKEKRAALDAWGKHLLRIRK